MKQLVMAATDMAIFAEMAIIMFMAIFVGALYRVLRPSALRRINYEACASMALVEDSPTTTKAGTNHANMKKARMVIPMLAAKDECP